MQVDFRRPGHIYHYKYYGILCYHGMYLYIHTYIISISKLKYIIYYIGDQDNDFVLESDHIIHNFTHM